jgi:hypothetical protein
MKLGILELSICPAGIDGIMPQIRFVPVMVGNRLQIILAHPVKA